MGVLPEHVSPADPARRTTAPYNFVPLPEAIFVAPERPPPCDRLRRDRLHGHVELTITSETELYTRCAYPPEDEPLEVTKAPSRQAFYHHGDESRPVIPGSSLRGMVRNLVEVLGFGRITRRAGPGEATRIRDERLAYRAVADQKTRTGQAYNAKFLGKRGNRVFDYPSRQVRAGYLEGGRGGQPWRIRPAKVIEGTSFVRVTFRDVDSAGLRSGQVNKVEDPVWVAPVPCAAHSKRRGLTLHYARTPRIAKNRAPGLVRAVLVCSGKMQTKHMHTAVYEKDPQAKPIPIPEELWERYCEDRDMQRGIPCRKLKKPGDPLFYLVGARGELEFFGPNLFFRIPYPNHTGDYVPAGTVDAEGPLDLAEAIFGTVNGERRKDAPYSGAHRGRVFFDDAAMEPLPAGESPFLDGEGGYRWPSVLSAPKPTSYQNYLVQRDPKADAAQLLGYASATPDRPEGPKNTTALRGFKRYWHRGSASEALNVERPTDTESQYTRIRPVRPGCTFRGRLRFENLTPLELGALLAALELPEGCRHHLGMGKPLGMGSVRVEARPVLIDPMARYGALSSSGTLAEERGGRLLDEARGAFSEAIRTHHRDHCDSRFPEGASIWDIPRLKELRCMVDWAQRPERARTDYERVLKNFRDRQVLPAPQEVLEHAGTAPQGAPQRPRPPQPAPGPLPPPLQELEALLKDESQGQRQRLARIDDALLARLGALDGDSRARAWNLIDGAIGRNKRTRDRLDAIRQALIGDST